MALAFWNMNWLDRRRLRLLLLLLLLVALPPNCAQAQTYSGDQMLTWLQHSNFGYAVLKPALLLGDHTDATCLAELTTLLQQADAKNRTALQTLDAWGKFPHGALYEHAMDMGNYESCLSQRNNKYCLTSISFETLTLRIGACLPASCSAAQLSGWLGAYLDALFASQQRSTPGRQLAQEQHCAVAQAVGLTALDWFAVTLLAVLGGLVLFGSLLDYGKAPPTLLSAFSLRVNLRQLLRTKSAKGQPNVIGCLHGIRCLTIIWIIFGHGYMFLLLLPNINAYEIQGWAQKPYSMLLHSGATAVDTFFLLSGMLLVLVTMRELERNAGKLNVPLMYLHRLLRLTPVLAVAVLLFVTLFPRLDNGPLWQQFTSPYKLCRSTWWATLLYVQNYAAPGRLCLGHSWYLAVDMQLFILSPLLLLPLWRWHRRAASGIVLLILLLFGCVFSIIVLNDLTVFQSSGNLGEDSPEMRKIYYTTHARATPWLIGLLFGYFLHREGERHRRLSRWLLLCLWLLALALLMLVIFVTFPYTQPGAATMTPLAGAFYVCCSRIAWPLSLCWLIWACRNGYGGLINTLLASSMWQPLSKLSYCLYVWHFLVETVHAGRSKTSLHFSNYDAILRFWSDFGTTLIVSLLMYLCVEAPFVRLELLCRLRRPRKSTPTATAAVTAIDSNHNHAAA